MGTCILHIYHSYLSVVILEVQLRHKILFCQCVGLVHTRLSFVFFNPWDHIYIHKEITGTILISNLRPFEIYINSYQTFDTKINMCAYLWLLSYNYKSTHKIHLPIPRTFPFPSVGYFLYAYILYSALNNIFLFLSSL